jgi:hypothetical protein
MSTLQHKQNNEKFSTKQGNKGTDRCGIEREIENGSFGLYQNEAQSRNYSFGVSDSDTGQKEIYRAPENGSTRQTNQ